MIWAVEINGNTLEERMRGLQAALVKLRIDITMDRQDPDVRALMQGGRLTLSLSTDADAPG